MSGTLQAGAARFLLWITEREFRVIMVCSLAGAILGWIVGRCFHWNPASIF